MSLQLRNSDRFLIILIVSCLFILANTRFVYGQNISSYRLNTDNTEVSFTARHFGVLKVKGQFNRLEGSLTLKNGIPFSSELTIYTESIDTNDSSRDRSVKGESFFDAKNQPTMSFTFLENKSKDELKGMLVIKDMGRQVIASYEIRKVGRQLIIEAECTISRSKFVLELSGMDDLVSDEVQIFAKIVLDIK